MAEMLARLLPHGRRILLIRGIERGQVATDAGFDVLHTLLYLRAGEVPVTVVHRLELAAVHRDHTLREQVS